MGSRSPNATVSVDAVSVMRRQVWNDMNTAARGALMRRGIDDIFDPTLRHSIGELIDDVAERGDLAVCDALAKFDRIHVTPDGLRVSEDEFERASVTNDVDAALDDAIAHLRSFNDAQMRQARDWSIESEPGLTVGEKITPITSAGLFTPSGKASYPSVAYQLAVPAVVAGVASISLVVPPIPGGNGEVDPAVLVVCRKLGIDNVFRVNGPAGVAALGFGTETTTRPKTRPRQRRPERFTGVVEPLSTPNGLLDLVAAPRATAPAAPTHHPASPASASAAAVPTPLPLGWIRHHHSYRSLTRRTSHGPGTGTGRHRHPSALHKRRHPPF